MDDLMKELEKMAIQTSQGSYLKVDDVRKLLEKRNKEALEAIENPPPSPKTMAQAKQLARKDEEITKHFPSPSQAAVREPGRSLPAGSTGNEAVKS